MLDISLVLIAFAKPNMIKKYIIFLGVSWAVAGRNESKLLQVLENASETVGTNLKETPKISKYFSLSKST